MYHLASLGCRLIALLFFFVQISSARADDWQLKRGDRTRVLVKRWSEILQKSPYSRKAFRELLKLHKKPAVRSSLYARWKQVYLQRPKSLSASIIYARVLQRQGKHSQALALWKSIAERSNDKKTPLLRIASIHLAQKNTREATAIFQKLLPLVNEKQRESLLLQILEVSLKARDTSSLAWLKPHLNKATWSSNQLQQIAQLYEQNQYWEEASNALKQLMPKARGAEKLRLILRLSRVEMNKKDYASSLKLIKQARKIGTLHAWMRWELLERETEINRRQKLLGPFVQKLARKWRKSKDTREIMFLARLYREDKQERESIELAQRALKLKPSLREPRLWIVEYFTKSQQFDEVNKHLQALAKYGHARASHMLQLVDALLRRAGYPLKNRWTPIQLLQTRSRYSRYGSFYMRRRFRRYRQLAPQWSKQKINESIQSWNEQRRKEWDAWKRYATKREEKDFTSAKRMLAQTLRRYSKDWDTMKKVEQLADQIGQKNTARRAMSALERAVEADPLQLRQMHLLFLQTQRERRLEFIVKRALRPPLAPLQAVLSSSWALRPWDELRGSYQKMTFLSKTSEQRSWQRQVCPLIKRVLKLGKTTKQRERIAALRPALRLQVFALRWQCGARGNKLREDLQLAEESLLQENDGPQKLLEVYVRSRLDEPLRDYLKRRSLASKPQELIAMFRPLLQSPWAKQATEALFAAFAGEKSREHQKARAEAILMLCQQRASCLHVSQAVTELVNQPPEPPKLVLDILLHIANFQLFPKERVDWLRSIQDRYKKDLRVQHFLAMNKTLYYVAYNPGLTGYTNPTTLRKELSKIWSEATISSLSLRETEPAELSSWKSSMRQMLYQLQSNHHHRDPLFLELLRTSRRFPIIYRVVIREAVTFHAYRKSLQNLLPQLLQQRLQWEDLPWLEQVYKSVPQAQRNQILGDALDKEQDYEALRLFAYLATRHGQVNQRLQALTKMLVMRPKDNQLLYKTALLLDRLGQNDRAEKLWMRYLSNQPEKRTIRYLERLSSRCCVDSNDRSFARRILHLSLKKNGLSAIWKPFQKLLPQLNKEQQRSLISHIAKTPDVPRSSLQDLAQLAHKKGFTEAALELYLRLKTDSPNDKELHKRLAELYDQQGEYKKAYASWTQSLSSQTASAKESFFLKQAMSYTQKGQTHLAALSYYRAYRGHKGLDQSALRERIAALLQKRKSLQAWAYWLMLGQHAEQCLTAATKHHDFLATTLPSQLWKANIPYRGTLFSFSRCHWILSQPQQRESLRYLAAYLKQSPKQKIQLRASVEQDEPDTAFLVQQRLQTLQETLLQFGVKKEQIEQTQLDTQGSCRKDDHLIVHHGISCSAFHRQAAVGSVVTSYQQFLTQDIDQDQVPDIQDQCPLLHEKNTHVNNRSYRRYRRLFRGIRTSSSASVPPKQSTNPGCPLNPQLAFQKLQSGVLQMATPISFSGYSSSISYAQRPIIGQIASLLRASPELGTLTIEITPIISPNGSRAPSYRSYNYRRYRRYRYRRYNYYRDPKKLSQRRLNAIGQILRQYKAPMHRIKLIQKEPEKRAGANHYTPPKIVLRFDPPQPQASPKTKAFPFPSGGDAIPL
ncbi:MAG: hypothetical protein H6727_20360 [Myxococcales bacterium]|nr:hypothetical protein [Myxococcales bacterium]